MRLRKERLPEGRTMLHAAAGVAWVQLLRTRVSGLESRTWSLESVKRAAAATVLLASACRQAPPSTTSPEASDVASAPLPAAPAMSRGLLARRALSNRAAYVPPQCFTKTHDGDGNAKNPCYVCHTRSTPPNYADDEDLQRILKLPLAAKINPWTNLLSPPVARVAPASDEEILGYVRRSNYFDGDGSIRLARTLARPPPDWDENRNGQWDGFVPDVQYRFDDGGFDRLPDGAPTGWRAFA